MSTAPMPGGPRRGPAADRQPGGGQPVPDQARPGHDGHGRPQGYDPYGPDLQQRERHDLARSLQERQREEGWPGPGGRPPQRPSVDPVRLWSGGVATAVVAALIALFGVLVSRWLFGIPLLAPMRAGAYGDVHTTNLVLGSAGAALAATALIHLLMLGTPRPGAFFAWIIGLATALGIVVPFSTAAPLNAKLATAALVLVLGVAIGSLVAGVAARSLRQPPGGGTGPYGQGPYGQHGTGPYGQGGYGPGGYGPGGQG